MKDTCEEQLFINKNLKENRFKMHFLLPVKKQFSLKFLEEFNHFRIHCAQYFRKLTSISFSDGIYII